MAFRQLAYLPDRRSTRTDQSVHITVRGSDASRVPYEEKVSTLSISCHGCRYLSRNNVLLGDIATLEVVHHRAGGSQRPAPARVRSVKQLAPNEMLFDVVVELESPQDIWGIASPPEDWAEFSSIDAFGDFPRELQIVPRPEAAKTSESRRNPPEPTGRSASSETCPTSPLPPLLVQLAATFREQIATTPVETARAAMGEDAGEHLHELCARIEGKAMKAFQNLVRAFVQELPSGAQQISETHKASTFSTNQHWTATRARDRK